MKLLLPDFLIRNCFPWGFKIQLAEGSKKTAAIV